MTTFDEREKAFENKFEHDMELQFKARARSNKLLGLWAAGLMGKSGEAAEAYGRDIVMAAMLGAMPLMLGCSDCAATPAGVKTGWE